MNTYNVTHLVEMTITHVVRAKNADEANERALRISTLKLSAIQNRNKGVGFGDIQDDYLPARENER